LIVIQYTVPRVDERLTDFWFTHECHGGNRGRVEACFVAHELKSLLLSLQTFVNDLK
jgi:hypothetical protein